MSSKNITKIVPIILAGGCGSRLWPLSRKSYPKQFINLINDDEYTLLQKTYKRIESIENICKPIIICNEEHRFIVAHQMKDIDSEPSEIVLEPEGKNTTPAITIAALKVLEKFNNTNIDPILLILSSDHVINDIRNFQLTIKQSISHAKEGKLVIFGVSPNYPSTSYGYIKSEDEIDQNNYLISRVDQFIEKPDEKTAKLLIKDKKYTWNSGMFVFTAKTILKEIKIFSPEILKNCEICLKKSVKDFDFLRLDKNSFLNCENISIDVAVFEKTKNAVVVPLNCGWNDIGSWESLWELSKKDMKGNCLNGKVLIHETQDSLIRSEDKLVVSIGLENIIIVETKDSVLVAKKHCSQDLKNIVSLMKTRGYKEAENHKIVHRPWGSFLSIEEGRTWQIKKIYVEPGASLSLQMHFHRSEHWVVVSGTAKIEIGNLTKNVLPNESVYIPLGVKHRLSNPTELPLTLIEIQSGNYLGEDDIKRFEDKYGR